VYLGSLLRLTLLARDLVEAILDGQQSQRDGLPRLLEPFPISWLEQLAAPDGTRNLKPPHGSLERLVQGGRGHSS
jgi:hypothetical protein